MMLIIITLYVQPGAKRTEVAGKHGEYTKIRLHALPVEGAANKALIEFVAKKINLKLSSISLIRGERSRIKTLRIEVPQGMELSEAMLLQKLSQ